MQDLKKFDITELIDYLKSQIDLFAKPRN